MRTAWLTALLVLMVAGQPVNAVAAAPTCHGERATVVGTDRADRLTGTQRRDVIVGRGGDDVIEGLGGHDLICGGLGADRLLGGPGHDRLYGQGDRRGEDVTGTFLLGDVLLGGAGDDLLHAGHDDRRAEVRRRPDTLSWIDATRAVVVDLRSGRATGRGHDTLRLSPRLGVQGSPHADEITGSKYPDRIAGEAGDDRIRAGAGADTVFTERATAGPNTDVDDDVVEAGAGDDLVSSQAGRDRVLGGAGDDFIEAYSAKPTSVAAGTGRDLVLQYVVPGSGSSTSGGAGDDQITLFGDLLEGGSPMTELTIDLRNGTTVTDTQPPATGEIAGFQRHRLSGNLRWRFHGTEGQDRLWAMTGGPLRARTYDGNDIVTATDRADVVYAGAGVDFVAGRGGKDICRSAEKGVC